MKTEYNRVQELADVFDKYWVPHTVTELKSNGLIVEKLIDEKSGDVYLERYDPILDRYSVYKFDKYKVPKEWAIEEDSNVKVKV